MAGENSWDFFISFATPDLARAEELADLLEQEWRVFLAHRTIGPGTLWNDELATALGDSRVVVVLLTEHAAKAHYQREEIHLAVHFARQEKLQLVPVYLEELPREPATWEFGLREFQRIDCRREGVQKTAEKLSRLLAEPLPTAGPAADPQERHTVGEMLHGASLRIDRTKQWLPLVEICASRENALFLLHGPRQQNLDLFVSRISHFLSPECGMYHRPYVVPLRVEYSRPRSAAAWENNLKVALAEEGQGHGTAADLLREAARAHAVFLVLSRKPLAVGDLHEDEVEALEEFLSDRLPRLIADASAGRHPIRALFATHYDSAEEAMVDRLDDKVYRGAERHGVRYRKLPPLQPLEWSDIEDFLNGFAKRPPRSIYRQLREAFEKLDKGSLQFREVVELLERELY